MDLRASTILTACIVTTLGGTAMMGIEDAQLRQDGLDHEEPPGYRSSQHSRPGLQTPIMDPLEPAPPVPQTMGTGRLPVPVLNCQGDTNRQEVCRPDTSKTTADFALALCGQLNLRLRINGHIAVDSIVRLQHWVVPFRTQLEDLEVPLNLY